MSEGVTRSGDPKQWHLRKTLNLGRITRSGQRHMSRRFYQVLATVVACSLRLSSFASAQAATATISGTVIDESAAVVPDASITILNLETGLQRMAAAGERGRFAIPLLPPGTYRVTAQRN